MAADPERSHIATTRSGCIVLITSAQMPPPECPQRTHGTLSNSGWPDLRPKVAECLQEGLFGAAAWVEP